jgi:hypothetical protein
MEYEGKKEALKKNSFKKEEKETTSKSHKTLLLWNMKGKRKTPFKKKIFLLIFFLFILKNSFLKRKRETSCSTRLEEREKCTKR